MLTDTMDLHMHVVPLRLRHRFTVAHGSTDLQHNLIVELREGELRGYGEASTIGYYQNSAYGMAQSIAAMQNEIEERSFNDPGELWDAIHPGLEHDMFALCAVDQAAHDLWGKRLGQPVWKLWGLDISQVQRSDYTIGLDDIPKMVEKLREYPDFGVYKIKLGSPDHDDLEILRALRAETEATFRVDPNCAWSAERCLELAPKLIELGVELIEQPLPPEDLDGMRQVFESCPLPLIADESCLVEADIERCAEMFHGVNIKLTKCGGLTPARRMIDHAKRLGLKVMVGCMTESTVGISAIGQLLPLLDYVDMDGALLLADDVADGVRVDLQGRVHYPDTPGCGVLWHGPEPQD